MNTQPEISVVLPVCNEENNIGVLLKEMAAVFEEKIRRWYEIIVVDDASEDRSAAVAGKTATDLRTSGFLVNCVCLALPARSGQSAALIKGIAAAKGKLIVTMDADLQHDPADMTALLEKMRSCDMVCGIRKGRRDGAARLLCSRIANLFRNLVAGYPVADSGCMFRIFKKECAPQLFSMEGKLYGCELLFFPSFVRRAGFRVQEMPVSHRKRGKGKSKYHLIRGRMLRGISATMTAREILKP